MLVGEAERKCWEESGGRRYNTGNNDNTCVDNNYDDDNYNDNSCDNNTDGVNTCDHNTRGGRYRVLR